MQLTDEEKISLLWRIFRLQDDTLQFTKKSNKINGGTVTNKLFITADLMQFFNDYLIKKGVKAISIGSPINEVKFEVGNEGMINNIHFEIISGKEHIYTGLEIYQSYINFVSANE